MKRVFVCSPLRARAGRTIEMNQRLAADLCRRTLIDGAAPFAPHVLYPQFMIDTIEWERNVSMQAARRWLTAAQEVWIFTRLGISEGMAAEIQLAKDLAIHIVSDPACWDGALDESHHGMCRKCSEPMSIFGPGAPEPHAWECSKHVGEGGGLTGNLKL